MTSQAVLQPQHPQRHKAHGKVVFLETQAD